MLQNSAPPTLLDQAFNISILHSEAVPAFLVVKQLHDAFIRYSFILNGFFNNMK